MIKDVVVKNLKKYEDERGWLSEFFRNDEIVYSPAMCYASMTLPGVIRGPHEHVNQSDMFVFMGPGSFEIYLWDRRKGSETEGEHIVLSAGGNEPKVVIVPPGVVHGYKCVSEISGFSINMPDKLYRGKGKTEEIDEIRWEDKDDSPYKIN